MLLDVAGCSGMLLCVVEFCQVWMFCFGMLLDALRYSRMLKDDSECVGMLLCVVECPSIWVVVLGCC